MAAIAQDEAVTIDNPLIFFAYQRDGKLLDLFSLSRSVYSIAVSGTATQVVANSALNLADPPTGVRVGLGIYHANFTATGFAAGTYEIRWRYQLASTDAIKENRQRFEVLDKTKFYTGALYVGYCTSNDLREHVPFDTKPLSDVQVEIDLASRRIEQLTARFFEPRIATQKLNGRGTRSLVLNEPIIGINKLSIESGVTGLNIDLTDISLDGIRMYARHLQGLFDPDDRDDPHIEIENFEGLLFQSLSIFPKGPQTIHVSGVYGYTDPDGGPMGVTPVPLFKVIGSMAFKSIADPFGLDKTITSTSSVTKAKTRDQEISYSVGGSTSITTSTQGLTGDTFTDQLLLPYVRPPHYGAV